MRAAAAPSRDKLHETNLRFFSSRRQNGSHFGGLLFSLLEPSKAVTLYQTEVELSNLRLCAVEEKVHPVFKVLLPEWLVFCDWVGH